MSRKIWSRFAVALLALPFVIAQDPLYNHGTFKRGRRWNPDLLHSTRTTASTPWRDPSLSSAQSYRPPVRDYSSHFLDFDEARNDKRTRYWKANLKSRRPGRLSLTSRIVWANIFMYALQMWRPSVTTWGVKRSDLILQGRELYRLFSPVWLHANPGHLFTNMFSLNRMGPDIEGLFGKGRFLATYVVSGVTGNLLSAYMSPNPGLGASGAVSVLTAEYNTLCGNLSFSFTNLMLWEYQVFGMLGAYVCFLSRHDWLLGRTGEDINSRLMQTIVLNVGLGLISPMIDNWAHLGGAIGGFAMAYYTGPRLYMVDTPERGRLVVDRPILRLPRNIESMSETNGNELCVECKLCDTKRISKINLGGGHRIISNDAVPPIDRSSRGPWTSLKIVELYGNRTVWIGPKLVRTERHNCLSEHHDV